MLSEMTRSFFSLCQNFSSWCCRKSFRSNLIYQKWQNFQNTRHPTLQGFTIHPLLDNVHRPIQNPVKHPRQSALPKARSENDKNTIFLMKNHKICQESICEHIVAFFTPNSNHWPVMLHVPNYRDTNKI